MFFVSGTAHAFATPGFQNPYGIIVDPKTNFIYISNVNGQAAIRDDNGFISRLKGDGTVDKLRFIDGASKDVALHAPKGMAIVGNTLYVADIDKLHAFDLNSGGFLFDVNFGDLSVQHLYNIALGVDDVLYVADGPANVIWKIDVPRLHEVTTFLSGDMLGQPHGICWYPARQFFVVVGWSSGKVMAFDRAGKRQATPSVFVQTLEGVTADDIGNLYIASQSLQTIYRLASNFGISTLRMGVSSPAGLAFSKAGNEVVVASFDTGVVQSLPLPMTQTK